MLFAILNRLPERRWYEIMHSRPKPQIAQQWFRCCRQAFLSLILCQAIAISVTADKGICIASVEDSALDIHAISLPSQIDVTSECNVLQMAFEPDKQVYLLRLYGSFPAETDTPNSDPGMTIGKIDTVHSNAKGRWMSRISTATRGPKIPFYLAYQFFLC